MNAKVKKGQWIVKLEKLIDCIKCNEYFVDQISFKKHQDNHEKEIKVEKVKQEPFSPSKVNLSQDDIKDSKSGKILKCGNCDKTFDKLHQLQNHYNLHHKETRFNCSKCNKKFVFKSQLTQHSEKCDGILRTKRKVGSDIFNVINVDGIKKYQCTKCESIYGNKESIYTHFQNKHREKKFKCDKCSKMFGVKYRMDRHFKRCGEVSRAVGRGIFTVINVNGVKKYQCTKCENTYENSWSVYPHFDRKHKEKKFKCEKCGKMFLFQPYLQVHMEKCDRIMRKSARSFKDVKYKEISNEDGMTKYQCLQCEKVFENLQYVHQHIYQVHREKEHKCDRCNKSFPFHFKLKKHLEDCSGPKKESMMKDVDYKETFDENGKKKFQCCKCENVYEKKRYIYQHFHFKHGEKKFKCEKCSKMFGVRFEIERHFKRCRGPKSENQFGTNDYHIITANEEKIFQCSHCEKSCKDLLTLHCHFNGTHREKKIECNKCGKMFAFTSKLERHKVKCDGILRHYMKVHREKNFKCKDSPREFPILLAENHTKKCGGLEKSREIKPTYKMFIDWDAKRKYQCELCDKVYDTEDDFHQDHLENCSGPKKSQVRFNDENMPSSIEFDSKENEIENEVAKDNIKENEDFKTEFIHDHVKTDCNEQDLDEGDPLQCGANDSVDNTDDENLGIFGI